MAKFEDVQVGSYIECHSGGLLICSHLVKAVTDTLIHANDATFDHQDFEEVGGMDLTVIDPVDESDRML